jgi:prepilin-type N-terminal cleavage/methylation domain-containing protein
MHRNCTDRTWNATHTRAAKRLTGFTLIELLVVVTIIVVLLALLTPALDKAVHEANYAVDGAQMKTIASGATLYATANKQFYPHRGAAVHNIEPKRITHENLFDDRVRFASYFPHETFNDPFLPIEVDWGIYYNGKEPPTSAGSAAPPPATKGYIVWASYTLLFGVKYRQPEAGAGMIKIGQSFGWGGEKTKVMVADKDDLWQSALGWGSHEPTEGPYVPETGNSYNHGEGWTIDRWTYQDIHNRGTLDNQFALTDGSVGRHRDLRANSNANNEDDRLMSFPLLSGSMDLWPATATRVPLR